MRRIIAFITLVASPRALYAGGFELAEQSPAGVATVGAQTAVAADAATVYYNPAGMAFQPGLGALAGGNLGFINTQVEAGQTVRPDHVAFGPTVYAAQRLGRHFAVGVGGFAQWAEHFDYPRDWLGRYLGTFVDLTTYTFNVNVAYRPIERVSVAVGLMVTPGSAQIRQAVNFGGADGELNFGGTAWGVGGNAAVLVDIVPRYLRFGYSYRSRQDMDFSGDAALRVPPELAAMAMGPAPTRGDVTIVLPHNMTFGLATSPVDRLTISTDIRYTLWSDAQALSLALSDSAGTQLMTRNVPLQLSDSVGVRIGGEYRLVQGRLPIRLGVGWDNTPVPPQTLSPLFPDTDRVLVSGGIGYHASWWSIEGGYLAAILLKETATNPGLTATYSNVAHVVSVALSLRLANLGGRLSANQPWSPSIDRGPLRAQAW